MRPHRSGPAGRPGPGSGLSGNGGLLLGASVEPWTGAPRPAADLAPPHRPASGGRRRLLTSLRQISEPGTTGNLEGKPAHGSAARDRVSGRSATASRSTRTSAASATTTGCWSSSGSSTSTSTPASTASIPATCAAGSAGTASTPSARQGIPGGRTAILEPEELEDRVLHAADPDRRRRADHRAAAGRSARSPPRYGRDVADITDRQNVQLHWIRIEDVPTIWEQLEAVGLSAPPRRAATPRG